METVKSCFCRRSQEEAQLKNENFLLRVELEKKNIRIQRLLATMKHFMVEHRKMVDRHEVELEKQFQVTAGKIEPFEISTSVGWVVEGPTHS